MSEPILQVENLITGFDTDAGRVVAVDGVSFTVPKGKTLGIVGESGCGKSVTAFSITRLLPQPHGKILGGRILFENRDLTAISPEDMRKLRGNDISMIFQEPMTALNPVQTIGKQLCEAVFLHHPDIEPREALTRSLEMLVKVRIPAPEQRLNEYPHQLSGGMRQRVMIAMALINTPKLLIADEPTTALDVTVQAQILELIRDMQQDLGMSVILITHDLGVIAEVCDDVAVMYAGRIAERGPVHEIFAKPLHPYTQGLIRCLPKLDHPPKTDLPVIPGMVPSLRDMPTGCRFASRCPNKHDDSVLTTRQPWKDCGHGHGVEACACFAAGLANTDEISYPQPHEQHQSTRNPAASFDAAARYLERSAAADEAEQRDRGREGLRLRQLQRLVEYAERENLLISSERYTAPDDMGSEHRVYCDADGARVAKITNTNRCGMGVHDGAPAAALVSEYFQRWELYNVVFGDKVEFEGVMKTPSGICLVISQPYVVGTPPTRSQVAEFMKSLGFAPTETPFDYYRASDNVAVLDCHELNMILGPDQQMYAIDVIPVYADGALRKTLGVEGGRQS